jgi:hypothetical protein
MIMTGSNHESRLVARRVLRGAGTELLVQMPEAEQLGDASLNRLCVDCVERGVPTGSYGTKRMPDSTSTTTTNAVTCDVAPREPVAFLDFRSLTAATT